MTTRSTTFVRAWLIVGCLLGTGCASSIYGWQVRTGSTAFSPSFNPGILGQEPVAVLGALTMPGLRGNEVGMDFMLGDVLHKVAPQIQIVSPQHAISQINQQGLTAEYTQMRADAEQSHILNRDSLQKIGTAIGARFVFQPRLAAFTQTMYDRWTFPAFGVVISQTRQSNLRMSVQLWDTKTGELLWASMAEGTMQSEAFAKDPVYMEDAVRVTLGSMISDFLNQKTASTYTPVNKFLNSLIEEAMPKEKPDNGKIRRPGDE
ncbi:MAG TPA: hypothetical protein VJ746_05235 [Nitrospira sp.]|nr:hypothetical protein [Nitrospira sp.]